MEEVWMSIFRPAVLQSGVTARIVVSDGALRKMDGRCFRGRRVECAGNFHAWQAAGVILERALVHKAMCASIFEAWQAEANHGSASVAFSSLVGWSTNAPLADFDPRDLEEFPLNPKSTALRVKLARKNILAPETSIVTVAFRLQSEKGIPIAAVYMVHPGEDTGEPRGDMTGTGRVFFDWYHPGVPRRP